MSAALALLLAMAQADDDYRNHPDLGRTKAECSSARARITFNDEGGDDARPTTPAGTQTRIWSCLVGGRVVLVKWNMSYPSGQCSAVPGGMMSVWVAGRKVVDRASIGDANLCFGSSAVRSIMVDARGRLTICQQDGEEKDCSVRVPRLADLKVDPAYIPAGVRTPPTLRLRYGSRSFCGSLTAQLKPSNAGREREDQTFADKTIRGAKLWGGEPGLSDKTEQQFRADIDNDGAIDLVTAGLDIRLHGNEWGRFTWGSPGKPRFTAFELPRRIKDADNLPTNDYHVAFQTRPVSIAGKNYLYAIRGSVRDADARFDSEAYYGGADFGGDQITRGLLELHPDGRTTLKCGWGPRLRPEEFL